MKQGDKVTIKSIEAILSLLDGGIKYKDSIVFNYEGMKRYCGMQGKIRDVWRDYSSKIYRVVLESDTEPRLKNWVWHVDWLIKEKNILEGDKL